MENKIAIYQSEYGLVKIDVHLEEEFLFILTSSQKEYPLKVPFQSYSPDNLGDGWEIAEFLTR